MLVRLHPVDREHRGEHHLRALPGRNLGDVMCGVAGDGALGAVRLAGVHDVAEAPRDSDDVDRGVAAADDNHAFADVAHAPVVERLQKRGRGHDVRRLIARAG